MMFDALSVRRSGSTYCRGRASTSPRPCLSTPPCTLSASLLSVSELPYTPFPPSRVLTRGFQMGSRKQRRIGLALLVPALLLQIPSTSAAGNTTCASSQLDWYTNVVGETPCELIRCVCLARYSLLFRCDVSEVASDLQQRL